MKGKVTGMGTEAVVSSFKAQYLREMTMENHEKPYSLQPVI
jgi:hypothetical protein